MTNRLTQKEKKMIRERYAGLRNNEIAQKFGVSKADVSQTFSRIADKINTIPETLEILQQVGVMKDDYKIDLTKSGKEYLEELNKKISERFHRQEAVEALGNLKDKRAVEVLLQAALKDENSLVRSRAVEALGNLKDERAVEVLLQAALKDENSLVRSRAAAELELTKSSSNEESKTIPSRSCTGLKKKIRVKCPCGYVFDAFSDEKAAIKEVRLHFERFHKDFLPFGITNAEALALLKESSAHRKQKELLNIISHL